MTPRTRSQDLTADLLHDLEVEEAAPTVVRPSASASFERAEPVPFAEVSLYPGPRTWQRPTFSRAGRSIAAGLGPVRVRIGRRSG